MPFRSPSRRKRGSSAILIGTRFPREQNIQVFQKGTTAGEINASIDNIFPPILEPFESGFYRLNDRVDLLLIASRTSSEFMLKIFRNAG